MKMAVKFVKLTSGDEFVADVELVGDKLKIKKPIRFIIAHDGIGAMPFLPLCKSESHEIDSKLIMLMDDLEQEIYNAYQEKFGTGIVIATNKTLKLSE